VIQVHVLRARDRGKISHPRQLSWIQIHAYHVNTGVMNGMTKATYKIINIFLS